MSVVIAGTRTRLKVEWKRDEVLVDPQQVLFSMWFWPATQGLQMQQTSYEYGVNPELVKQATGVYYVEALLPTAGLLKYTFRSVAEGEEVNVEYTVDVVARSVLEKA